MNGIEFDRDLAF